MTRRDVERSIDGKDTDAVCRKLGAPNSTSKTGGTEYWYYRNVTADPMAGRPDVNLQVVSDDASVRSVNFR